MFRIGPAKGVLAHYFSGTRLPYSVTCWTAGVLGLRMASALAALAMFQILRFYLSPQPHTLTSGLLPGA